MLYNPVYEFERFRKIMDGMLSDVVNYRETDEKANLFDSDKGYMLQFFTPGVKKEDVSVDFSNGLLSVKVKRSCECDIPDTKILRNERSNYDMTRSYRVPDDADVEKIDAQIQNGLLMVFIPRKESAKPKKIEIKVQ